MNYEKDWMLREDGHLFVLRHMGKIGDWSYHNSEEAVLITRQIKPRRIKLIRIYDLVRLVG